MEHEESIPKAILDLLWILGVGIVKASLLIGALGFAARLAGCFPQ